MRPPSSAVCRNPPTDPCVARGSARQSPLTHEAAQTGPNWPRRRLGSMANNEDTPTDPDQMLSPAQAAQVARRSVRTIRRAYASGRLRPYRDGGGRGVNIRRGDLRAWLMSEEIGSRAR